MCCFGQCSKDFEEFWRTFPRRVGKLAAQKWYEKVRKAGVTQQELIEGVKRYIRTKPSYADFCHPKTWLSQGRWLDEPEPVKGNEWDCSHVPPCPDRWSHGQLVQAEASGDPTLLAGVRQLIAKRVQA